MVDNKIRKADWKKLVIPVGFALVTFALTEVFSRFPAVTESIYSQSVFPATATLLSFLNKWVPFSIDDFFYGLLIISFFSLIIFTLFRKITIAKSIRLFIQTIAICYAAFYWLWGFNYYRLNLNDRLDINRASTDTVQFISVLKNLIDETNATYCSFDSISKPEISRLVESSYQNHAAFLKIKYPHGTRVPKPITLSSFFAKAGISGYYGPFFSEIHLNDSLLMIEYPQVLAHESAHQFGITSEAEANFYSWLVCNQSHSKHLKYSANINLLGYFLVQARKLHQYPELIKSIREPVINDFRRIQKHWDQMRDEQIDKAAEKVNDAYLKTNKIKNGIDDYFGVVQFVMDYKTDAEAQKKVSSRSSQ